ncbi:MAG TPA: lytic transglycosylase domain-containing protein, partial [Vicinamibacteria bacterium]
MNSGSPSAVAIRQGGDRRCLPDRRQEFRPTPERRVSQRRRCARIARAGLVALLALALPKKEGTAPGPGLVEVIKTEFRLADSRENLDPIIMEAANRYGVRPDLVRAIIQVESGFNPVAVSRVGARGLMQLMPRTAAHLGASDLFDPQQNIYAGVKYLSMLLDRFDGNVALAVAGYNAGPNAVGRYRGRIPPFRETRGYVKKVQAAQAGWIRENGETNLEPFEIRPAML